MRSTVAAPALLALLAACGGKHSSSSTFPPPGKPAGQACAASSECQAGLVCTVGACGTLAAAASCPSPPGTQTLVAGTMFDPGDPGPSACVSTVRSPAFGAPADIVVQDLGEHQVGETVTFAVTTGTSSLTIVSQEVNGSAVDTIDYQGLLLPNTVVPDQLKTPAGTVYYDDFSGTAAGAELYLGVTPVSGALTAPNTSAGVDAVRVVGQLAPGTWSFQANDWARECLSVPGCTGASTSGRYQLHAVTRTAPVTATGALDVEVYLLVDPTGPSSAIATAAAAAANPQLQRWTASMAYYLARAGLCIGNVTFHDLPTWVHTRFPNGSVDVEDGPCDPLQQLFTTAVVPSRGVHLFLVDELVSAPQGGAIVVGVDGSIPGPSGFPGTVWGGAAIGLFGEIGSPSASCPASGPPALRTCGADRIAYVAAHEVGHWLGLSHTTEATGDFFDPISDTPQCPCSSCAAVADRPSCAGGSVVVTVAQCSVSAACGGGNNLMFWLLDPSLSTGQVSRDQGQVVRLNPAVR